MATSDTTPTYNLGAVLQETGLKADTLRAWERRYGLPRPARSVGGHRLYSPRDIETLKWFVAGQQQGLSISRAVALWHQLENQGQDPLLEPAYALVETRMRTIAARAETLDAHSDEKSSTDVGGCSSNPGLVAIILPADVARR